MEVEEESVLTRSRYGTIGIDFNKGFLAIAETNERGHLISNHKISYRYRSGNKTRSDLEQVIHTVMRRALTTGKDIIIEDLSFAKKKAGLTKAGKKTKGARYNEMLNSLAYRTYTNLAENITFRNRVRLAKINPYNTSKIAAQKFCGPMKLNVHMGAAYVIARRGQGFQDALHIN